MQGEEDHMNQKTSRTCCDGGLSNYRPRKMDGMGRRTGKIGGGGGEHGMDFVCYEQKECE